MAYAVEYSASATGQKFHQSGDFIRAIVGPVGSGKTVAAMLEILYKAMKQERHR